MRGALDLQFCLWNKIPALFVRVMKEIPMTGEFSARPLPLVVIAALFALTVTSGARAAERTFRRSFSVGKTVRLSLDSHTGSVNVIAGDSGEIRVIADVRGRDKDVRDFDISAAQSGDEVSVRGVLREEGTWVWYSPRLSVSFTIRVPRECGLKLKTGEGWISVDGVRGVLKGRTSTGDITLALTQGNATLETRSGSVRADSCGGTLDLSTSGGGAYINHVDGDVDVSTSAGDVTITDVTGSIRAQTEGGNMVLSLTGPNRGIHAESSGGDIRISLPLRDSGDIDAEATGGEVVCAFPGHLEGTVHADEIDARLNGGGSPIFAHTQGGSVRIGPGN